MPLPLPPDSALTITSLADLAVEIARSCPPVEIFVGEGEEEAFSLAVSGTTSELQVNPITNSMELTRKPDGEAGWNLLGGLGIPIKTSEYMPPGVGVLSVGGQAKTLLYFRTGTLTTFSLGKSAEMPEGYPFSPE
jgi:hypothetical protein